MVKLVGHNLLCSATVIGRQQLLTANHCVESGGPFFVVAGGSRIPVTGHSQQGQTTLLTLASPLPAHYVPIPTGARPCGLPASHTASQTRRPCSIGT